MFKTLLFIVVLIGIFRCKKLLPYKGSGGKGSYNKGKGNSETFFVADLSRGKKNHNYNHG